MYAASCRRLGDLRGALRGCFVWARLARGIRMFLTDNETKVDLLNTEPLAKSVVALLRDSPERPVTVGIHGDWGAGKSSILEMIEACMESEPDTLCIKFNGWRFQGFEDAKIALIEGIVTALVEKRPMLTNAGDAVKDVFRRIDWLKVARHAGGLAFSATTGLPAPDMLAGLVDRLKSMVVDPEKLATRENLQGAIEGAKDVLKPSSKNVPEEIEGFRRAFDELLAKAGVSQLVVLIDDLDRCLPDHAIETLEAVRLFVFTAKTAFVVAADEAMIEYSVRKHFPDLPDTTGPRDYARNYLEKLIQVPFRIPALGDVETRAYISLLLIGAELGEDHAGFSALIAKARDRLQRPWASEGIDAALLRETLGDEASRAGVALALSDQIAPVLARGTLGNPRQIKRFLNALLLRQHTAQARGFGDDVKRPVLAKLMLAERFIPRLFDRIAFDAAQHPKGYCERLAELERPAEGAVADSAAEEKTNGRGTAAARSSRAATSVRPPPPPRADTVLDEWRADERITEWASLQPELAGVDLRPYLFVARDRKDFFGARSTLGHLEGVVDMLLLPKLALGGRTAELGQLAPAEAGKVFEALRSRVMASDSFDRPPAGIDGIIALVAAHPILQPNLLDLVEQLPSDRCGAWAVRGWNAALTAPESKGRLAEMLKAWADQDVNRSLKMAASAAVGTASRKGR